MFERFTPDAKEIVVQAQQQARALGHAHIGTEHLLLALLDQDGAAASALALHGLDRQSALRSITSGAQSDELDADALSTIGIDLSAVREKVEATFGAGALERGPGRRSRQAPRHIPFTKSAKRSLELALREAVRLDSREITDRHLLLGILREEDGLGCRIMVGSGISVEVLRAELEKGTGQL